MDEVNPQLHAAIMEIVETQMLERNPPETKQTYDRLCAEGFSEAEAKRLLGCVVTSEIFEVLKQGEPYDPVRYTKALAQLPKLPWDE